MKNKQRLVLIFGCFFICLSVVRALDGQLLTLSFTGPVTNKTVNYQIYLPPDYNQTSDHYPVIYHLHGLGGSPQMNSPQVTSAYESALNAGVIRPVILVFPTGWNSFWADSKSGHKPAETNVIRELIDYVDTNYRTIPERGYRVIQGMSMGGFGTMAYMSKFPHLFSIAVSYDGALLTWSTVCSMHSSIASEIFENDEDYFNLYSPWTNAVKNADLIRGNVAIRQIVADLTGYNQNYRDHLQSLNIYFEYITTSCAHDLSCMLSQVGEDNFAWIDSHFGRDLSADLTYDGCIDFGDYSIYALKYLDANCMDSNLCDWVDLDTSGAVDPNDLKVIARGWLNVPEAPNNLIASAHSSSEIYLTWNDNSSDETAFEIERRTGAGGIYEYIDAVKAGVTNYPDSNLLPDTDYYYRVRALRIDARSAYSNDANAVTDPPDVTPPAAPTGLTGFNIGTTDNYLTWNNNTEPDLAGYNIYRSTISGFDPNQSTLVDSSIIENSYLDSGLDYSTTYFYKVTAVDVSSNESDPSNEVSATTQDP